jgi:hypothetical protein
MINNYYNQDKIKDQIAETFNITGSFQLYGFLETDYYKNLLNKIKKLKFENFYNPEEGKCSFFKTNDLVIIEIKKYLENLFGFPLRLTFSEFVIFGHKDYTLMNDSKKEVEGIKVFFELSDFNEDFGGYSVFIKNNEEIYRTNSVSNSLIVVKTDPKMKSFVKYVNNKSNKKERLFLALCFI